MGTKNLKGQVAEVKKNNTQTVATGFAMSYREGILPSPDELEIYEKYSPGITDRLMATYEKQVNHRIEIESQVIKGDIFRANLGLFFGFVIAVLFFIVCYRLIVSGYGVIGITGIITAIASLVTIFIRSTAIKQKQLNSKK